MKFIKTIRNEFKGWDILILVFALLMLVFMIFTIVVYRIAGISAQSWY